MTGFAPTDRVLVSPVYLAGPGNSTVVTRPRHAAGWSEARTPAGRIFSSPCVRAQIAVLPDGWTISYAREPLAIPDWTAHFTRDTPAEIVSAFTTTLVHSLPDNHRDHRPGGPHHTPAGPGDVLIARGWRDDHSPLFHYQHAPDGHAYLRLNSARPTSTPHWKARSLPPRPCRPASEPSTDRAGTPTSSAAPPCN